VSLHPTHANVVTEHQELVRNTRGNCAVTYSAREREGDREREIERERERERGREREREMGRERGFEDRIGQEK
jgi:hypothetical protein